MTEPIRVYVNSRGVEVPAGATALDAVRGIDPDAAGLVESGDRALTDSRGLPLAADAPAYAGLIVRIVSGRRRREPEER